MIELETERPPVAVTTEGQPSVVETYGNASFAHDSAAGKPDSIAIPRDALLAASAFALATGRTFQRHWIIHYGKAGIDARDGARFVSHVLALASKQARREGGELTALWVRERASEKGEHAHILLHLPAAMRLHGRTRRWIETTGGQWQPGVSRIRIIGGRLSKVGRNRNARLAVNAANVTRYLLKAANAETGARLDLTRAGCGGEIIGKRCGWTQNIGKAARGGKVKS